MSGYGNHIALFASHLEKFRALLRTREPSGLYAPLDYMLGLGGKRVRPLMAIVACDLLGESPETALDAALAVEVFHNFSLIHDDLLDNAPVRRSEPTVHVKWNAQTSILSGDAMLVESLRALESYPAEQFKQLSMLLSSTAVQVCEGQQMDMEFERAKEVPVARYVQMITLKTAVLLACSLKMGAITANADPQSQEALYIFGRETGVAFQLLDDLLDVFAEDRRAFGKQGGGDILANKKTFLYLKALELADSAKKTTLLEAVNDRGLTPEKKIAVVTAIYRALHVDEACRAEASRLTTLAVTSLAGVDAPDEKKDALRKFAISLLSRNA